MKKATIITLIAAAALVAGYLCFFGVTREKYDSPPNTIGKIKYFEPVHKTDAYRLPTLTPVGYSRTTFSQSVTAKAIYKGETIGLRIVYRRFADKIELRSIGAKSDLFVRALAELYDETPAATMRRRIPATMGNDGGAWIDWRREAVSYKLSAPGQDGREAEMQLTIDIPGGTVSLGDRHDGLAKKRFTDTFGGE